MDPGFQRHIFRAYLEDDWAVGAGPFENLQEALQAVADKKIDAFVLNEQVLKFAVKRGFSGRVQVLPETFDDYFISIALQENSPFRKPINKALLKFMKSEKWTEWVNRHMKLPKH